MFSARIFGSATPHGRLTRLRNRALRNATLSSSFVRPCAAYGGNRQRSVVTRCVTPPSRSRGCEAKRNAATVVQRARRRPSDFFVRFGRRKKENGEEATGESARFQTSRRTFPGDTATTVCFCFSMNAAITFSGFVVRTCSPSLWIEVRTVNRARMVSVVVPYVSFRRAVRTSIVLPTRDASTAPRRRSLPGRVMENENDNGVR